MKLGENVHTPDEITIAHRIAFFYLYFATETDKQLAPSEMMAISEKVENCINKNNDDTCQNLNAWDIVAESLNWYTSLNPLQKEESFSTVTTFFKEHLSKDEKSCILSDLHEIAKSDGVIIEAENDLIQKTEKLLES